MTDTTKLLAAAVAVAMCAACRPGRTEEPLAMMTAQGSASVSPAGIDAAKAGRSMVRVLNALPSTKKVELTGDDRTLFSDVKYKELTAYAEVRDNLIVFRALSTDDNSVLADDHATMLDGDRYTALVLPDAKGGTQLKLIRDDVVPAAGMARLRVINAAPTVRDADVTILGEREPVFKGADFADEAGYKDINPGTVTLDVRQDAKTAKPMSLTPLILKPMHLVAGKAYTIVIVGGKGAPVETFTFEDAVMPTGALAAS